ncbi:hypothetical protein NXY28_07255 [Bacteroides thetaiotaomicron]|nr:hypothetical protein NXY28_07255 [Bacteroides thetaiotaomicron]
MKFHVSEKSANQKGKKYDFTYIAGKSKDLINPMEGLNLGELPGHWMVMTRDLWKDFGNITLTGISFICPERRDAGFDEIFLAKTQDDIKNAPKVLPSEIATPCPLMEKRKGWYMKREQLMRMNNRKGYRLTGLHRLKREDS